MSTEERAATDPPRQALDPPYRVLDPALSLRNAWLKAGLDLNNPVDYREIVTIYAWARKGHANAVRRIGWRDKLLMVIATTVTGVPVTPVSTPA
jgi:hypothetical protein